MKKIVLAVLFLGGGYYFLRKITKRKLNVKDNIDIQDSVEENKELIFGGNKCPISEESIEEQRKIIEMRNKMNPLRNIFGSSYTAPQYPFEWDELCTKQQISDFRTSLQDGLKNLMDNAKKGLMPPMLSPQQTINISKQFGKGESSYDPNKDYNTYCGTEMCWKWDGKRWIKD